LQSIHPASSVLVAFSMPCKQRCLSTVGKNRKLFAPNNLKQFTNRRPFFISSGIVNKLKHLSRSETGGVHVRTENRNVQHGRAGSFEELYAPCGNHERVEWPNHERSAARALGRSDAPRVLAWLGLSARKKYRLAEEEFFAVCASIQITG
jgi:hypothetical protein